MRRVKTTGDGNLHGGGASVCLRKLSRSARMSKLKFSNRDQRWPLWEDRGQFEWIIERVWWAGTH